MISELFKIEAAAHTYSVEIAAGLLQRCVPESTNIVVLCDSILVHTVPFPAASIISLDAHEHTKDLAAMSALMVELKSRNANRKTIIYAIGGGVIQDVACFVASVYMRGTKWIYFPTTLLGMTDSCIGGKSSINAGGYKNLVGTYHPPQAVLIDPDLAQTLNDEQRVAGLCEAVKICFAHHGSAFPEYLAIDAQPSFDAATLQRVLTLTLKTKKWFIEIDEFDRNERLLLNFAHTFGHALEAALEFSVSHGVGVGVGMLCALNFGRRRGFTTAGTERVAALAEYTRGLLAHVPSLKSELAKLDPDLAVQKFTADKKHDASSYWIIAPNRDGHLERTALPKTEASRIVMREIFTIAKENYERLYD